MPNHVHLILTPDDRTRARAGQGVPALRGPLVFDGEEVGATGVSAAQPDWDIQIAAAGAAFRAKLP